MGVFISVYTHPYGLIQRSILRKENSMGCNCGPGESTGLNDYVGYQGLGQIDVGLLSDVIGGAKAMWDDLLSALGVGAGRKEADVIVPLQNKVVSDVIAPVFAYIDAVNNKGQAPDCSLIRNFAAEVKLSESQWLNFLHTTHWSDGRAAQQAEATLAPYFTQAKTGLQDLITKDCSSGVANTVGNITASIGNVFGGMLTTPTGQMNWPVVLLGAGAVFFLMRRK